MSNTILVRSLLPKNMKNCLKYVCAVTDKMLEALRQCEPEMPTLLGCGDGSTNAVLTMDFFTQSTPLGMRPQATGTSVMAAGNGSLIEDVISSTSSPSSSSTASLPTSAASVVVHTLAELYDRELVSTIGWAKQIPGTYRRMQVYARTFN